MTKKLKHVFQDHTGTVLKKIPKGQRDLIAYLHGSEQVDERKIVTTFSPENPKDGKFLKPGPNSPICQKCQLNQCGARNPYMPYQGAEDPLITIIVDHVSAKEDDSGVLGSGGQAGFMLKLIQEMAPHLGIDPRRIRWVPLTRCSPRQGKLPNFKTKGGHCRAYAIQDLELHPPKLIIPVGTAALGLLSHKSSAQDWGGKLLTYRGWPDDWITDSSYVLPRDHPAQDGRMVTGHPLFGPAPQFKIPMAPVQSPRLIYASQNPTVIKRWKKHVEQALIAARDGVQPMEYDRPWFKLTEDPAEVINAMTEIRSLPEGRELCYDTETTGLKPWGVGQSIVFQMFRWDDANGNPQAIGFPWNFEGSALKPCMNELAPHILEAMYSSTLIGHNLTFDILFACADIPGVDIHKLTAAAKFDTWHMAYTARQATGSLGLDILAYDWVKDMAGYEEDMTLLISLYPELLDPSAKKGGHYANCPKDKWDSHLKIYVMGDVEVAWQAKHKIKKKLEECRTYRIPLAHPEHRGRFRHFSPPSRNWVYENIMSPASRTLQRFMARGIFVDLQELQEQEDLFPKKIREERDNIRKVAEVVEQWCQQKEQEAASRGEFWEFDPENKEQLKDVLFKQLKLPVQRLTPQGRKLYGEDLSGVPEEVAIKYAALDKFTLNKLAVDFKQVRPLQEYRKVFKQYTTYVRPMRNLMTKGIDKKNRTEEPHLARDGCVHTSFKLTGTRGGRLSACDPNLQQLPRDGLIKRLYISRFGKDGCIYQGDMSQIELRIMAAACGDAEMVRAYHEGIDLHSLTHSLIYEKPYEECTGEFTEKLQAEGKIDQAKKLKEERKVSKCCNFLTGFGGGAFGLQTSLAQQGLYFSLERCENILERFFDSYSSLRTWLGHYKRFIQEFGVAVSIFGRVRIFEEMFSDDNEAKNKALRAGCNHVIQSTASDLMLICLNTIEHLMRFENLESQLILTVHDSLAVDTVKDELDKVHEICYSVLNNIPEVLKLTFGEDYDLSWLLVPIAGDCEVGPNLLDAVKIPAKGSPDWKQLLALSSK